MDPFLLFTPIRTPKDLAGRKKNWRDCIMWIRSNIGYENQGSMFPDPVGVISAGRTNCKGFSTLTAETLFLLGYSPRIVSYAYKKGSQDISHAVVLFQDSGTWKCISNGLETDTKVPQSEPITEAVKTFSPTVYYAQEVDRGGSHLQTLVSKI